MVNHAEIEQLKAAGGPSAGGAGSAPGPGVGAAPTSAAPASAAPASAAPAAATEVVVARDGPKVGGADGPKVGGAGGSQAAAGGAQAAVDGAQANAGGSQADVGGFAERSDAAPKEQVQRLLRLRVPVRVQLAARKLSVAAVRRLSLGAILEFSRCVDDPLTLLVNNQPLGEGEAVKVGEHFGLRVRSVRSRKQRIMALGRRGPG